MQYVISDLHGDLDSFKSILEKIQFQNTDEMFVLGDVIDRGDESIKLLFELMSYGNIFPILGNHEFMFIQCVRKLPLESTIDDFVTYLDEEDIMNLSMWISNGGRSTFEQYLALEPERKEIILDYLDEFVSYDQISIGGSTYVLTHSGIMNFDPHKDLEEYATSDFLFFRPEQTTQFYADKTVIFGHTPTPSLNADESATIFKRPSWINIDCGCGFKDQGGRLACLRLNDMAEFYA